MCGLTACAAARSCCWGSACYRGLTDYTPLARRPALLAALGTASVFLTRQPTGAWRCLILLLPAALALAVYGMAGKGNRGPLLCLGLLAVQLWLAVDEPCLAWPVLACGLGLLAPALRRDWFGGNRRLSVALLAVFAAAALAFFLWALTVVWGGEGLLRQWGFGAQDRAYLAGARLFGQAELPPWMAERLRTLVFWREWDFDAFLFWVLLRWGWAAFAAVQLPVVCALAWGWRRCRRLRAALGRLLGEAALLSLTCQAALYLAQTATGLRDLVTRFPYPFLTCGGTALVLDFALLGLLAAVLRGGSLAREDARGGAGVPRRTAGACARGKSFRLSAGR